MGIRPQMARVAGVGVWMMLAMPMCAQQTFDEYFLMVKERAMGTREISFMKECGIADPAATDAVYGVKLGAIENERWSPRELLGKGKEEGFDDYFTAEIRAVDGKPRVINTWRVTTVTGESENAMYCLSAEGKVKTVLTLNIYDPPAGVKATATRYLRRQEIGLLEHVTADHGTFVDAADQPVAAPKLSKQDMSAAVTPAPPGDAYGVLRDLWAIRKGPIVVPYEQPEIQTQGNR